MKRPSFFVWLALCVATHLAPTAQKPSLPQNNFFSITYSIASQMPYIREAVAAGMISYSAVAWLIDCFTPTHAHKASPHSPSNTNPTTPHHDQTSLRPRISEPIWKDPFAQFRELATHKKPFIPGGTVVGTVYEEVEQLKQADYRAFLKSFVDYEDGICPLANHLRNNPEMRNRIAATPIEACSSCKQQKEHRLSVLDWILDSADAIEHNKRMQDQENRNQLAQEVLDRQCTTTMKSDAGVAEQQACIIKQQREIAQLYHQFELDAYHQRLVSLAHSSLEQALEAIETDNPELLTRAIARKNALLETVAQHSHMYNNAIIINDRTNTIIGREIALEPYQTLHGNSIDHEINSETLNIFDRTSNIASKPSLVVHTKYLPEVIAHLGEGVRLQRKSHAYLYAFNLLDIGHGIVDIVQKSIARGCERIVDSFITHPIETIADTALVLTMPQVAMTKFIGSLLINHESVRQCIKELACLVARDPKEGLAEAGGFLFEMFVVHKGMQVGGRYGPSTLQLLKQGVGSYARTPSELRRLSRRLGTSLKEVAQVGKNLRNAITNALRTVDGWAGQLNEAVRSCFQEQAYVQLADGSVMKIQEYKDPQHSISKSNGKKQKQSKSLIKKTKVPTKELIRKNRGRPVIELIEEAGLSKNCLARRVFKTYLHGPPEINNQHLFSIEQKKGRLKGKHLLF